MNSVQLRRIRPAELPALTRQPFDQPTADRARRIVQDVRATGEPALRRYAAELDRRSISESLMLDRSTLDQALDRLDPADRAVLQRTADRIRRFAQAQADTLSPLRTEVPGGHAGHHVIPVDVAGCYAPGGRYPLPSSALMTTIPARVAGVREVWLASPNPSPLILAAAAVAEVDGVLAVGGAHAIAALAYGIGGPSPAAVVCGPGNKWVTAAKYVVSLDVGIDMLAGPSELVVLADASADPALVAADLLAQAEHDVDAIPILVTSDETLATRVDHELTTQLTDLPTAETARAALQNGFTVLAEDLPTAAAVCNRLAPEHLAIHIDDAPDLLGNLHNYGSVFVGHATGEVFGDYGLGPNHVLPTGGTARHQAGLSVFTFLRARTWLQLDSTDNDPQAFHDVHRLAELEGLFGHARSAARRR